MPRVWAKLQGLFVAKSELSESLPFFVHIFATRMHVAIAIPPYFASAFLLAQ